MTDPETKRSIDVPADWLQPDSRMEIHAALIEAARVGNSHVITRAIDLGADPNTRAEHEQTPLHLAAMSSSPESTHALLQSGADPRLVNVYGETPLHVAAHAGHVDELVDYGADPNVQNNRSGLVHGRTPLHQAARNDRPDVVERLVARDADVNLADLYDQATALHQAAHARTDAITGTLIRAGAIVTAVDRYGDTALHGVGSEGQAKTARRLIEAGADVHAANRRGETPLHVAASANNETVGLLLMENGASPDVADKVNQTPATINPSMIAAGIEKQKDVLRQVAETAQQTAGEEAPGQAPAPRRRMRL